MKTTHRNAFLAAFALSTSSSHADATLNPTTSLWEATAPLTSGNMVATGGLKIGTAGAGGGLEFRTGGVLISKGILFTSPALSAGDQGAGARFLWYPRKAAIRAGNVVGIQWDDVKIGTYSTAFGYNTTASGGSSTAFGSDTAAAGTWATAFGNFTNATGNFSTAVGSSTTASGAYSTSLGISTLAAAYGSTALGAYNVGGGNATAWVATDPLLEIGNGTSAVPANALTVLKNGNTSISGALTTAGAISTSGSINLTGTNGSITANGTPLLSVNSATNAVSFPANRPFAIANTTASATSATGALTVAGGLGVTGAINTDSNATFNRVTVGRGGGTGNNTAVGEAAMQTFTTSNWNTALGTYSLYYHSTGDHNVAVGHSAGNTDIAGVAIADATGNTYLGNHTKGAPGAGNNYNSIVIGYNAVSEGSHTTVIGNTSTTKTHLFGETLSNSLKVSGGSHLAATAENLLNLPAGVTGSYFGPQKTGVGFYQHDFLFTKTGDETTADFTVPLGLFINNGAELTVDISTPSGDPDSGSAHYVLNGSRHWEEGTLVASEYCAFGGAAGLELVGRNHNGYITLYVKFDAKNYSAGQVYEHGLQVKVSGFASAQPQMRDYPLSFQYPISKVDSTTRANYGTVTKTISASQINLNGKVTLSQAQGDISMGIYQ
jgi:Head domain of trimeric autotransporter adhesin